MTRDDTTQRSMNARIDALCENRGIDRDDLPDMATVDAALNGDYL